MPSIKLNVKSVIFDMDGVITNTMPDHYRSWKKIMSDEGIDVSFEDIYKREGQRGINSVKEIFTEHNRPFDRRTAERILRKKEALFKRIVRMRFIVGARSFLKFLHRRDMQLALVTGTSRHEMQRILPSAICGLFSVVVTGSDVRHGKPHPEPYLRSLQELKIAPAEAVVIENAPFGIRSAKQAGLRTFALETSLSKKYLKEADAVFASIKDMKSKVLFTR